MQFPLMFWFLKSLQSFLPSNWPLASAPRKEAIFKIQRETELNS